MRCLITCLIAAVLSTSALAQQSAQQGIVLRTLSLKTSVPAPPWTEFTRIARDSESMRSKSLSQEGTDLFVRAYVPKGQSFDDWQERYEVRAESPVLSTPEKSRDAYAAEYVQACVNTVMAPVLNEPDRQVFVLFCPSFRADPDFGELVVTVSEKRGDTLVQVNYLQRVPAFDIMDDSTMPKSHKEMLDLVTYLNAAHLVPS